MARSECHRYGYGRLVCNFGDSDNPMFGITFGGWVSIWMVPDINLDYQKLATRRLLTPWGSGYAHSLRLFCFNIIWSVP